jgi:hypothetical protein
MLELVLELVVSARADQVRHRYKQLHIQVQRLSTIKCAHRQGSRGKPPTGHQGGNVARSGQAEAQPDFPGGYSARR